MMLNTLLVRAAATGAITLLAALFVLFPDNSRPDQLAHFLSDYVNDGFQVFAYLCLFYFGWRLRSWRPALYVAMVGLSVTTVVQLSKRFLIAEIARRPSGGYEGFPSGHASATFSLAFVLSLYYPRLWPLWYGVAALVTWSRIQTNAHTELQIVAGMVLGSLLAYGCAVWLKEPDLATKKSS